MSENSPKTNQKRNLIPDLEDIRIEYNKLNLVYDFFKNNSRSLSFLLASSILSFLGSTALQVDDLAKVICIIIALIGTVAAILYKNKHQRTEAKFEYLIETVDKLREDKVQVDNEFIAMNKTFHDTVMKLEKDHEDKIDDLRREVHSDMLVTISSWETHLANLTEKIILRDRKEIEEVGKYSTVKDRIDNR